MDLPNGLPAVYRAWELLFQLHKALAAGVFRKGPGEPAAQTGWRSGW